ncbi:hypothetical protein, partial [Bradyrhizobium sp. NBAIM08]|uniref:hypothetical protein n=1 Tax=Bradyrhizobium sp. NBAIM08 TaxID=2793815 RepID=UPI001CD4EB12
MNALDRPELAEVPSFYHGYVALAEGHDLLHALRDASARAVSTMSLIPVDHWDHRYTPGKWSIK